MIFESERQFRLWFYTVSHSTLYLRSEKQYEDVLYENIYKDNCTIDIEFFGVKYIDIIAENLLSLKIKRIYDNIFNGVILNNEYEKIYEIETKDKKFYIIASACIIGKSSWGHNEGRYINPSLNYDEIILNI